MKNPFQTFINCIKNLSFKKEKPYVQKVPDNIEKSNVVNSNKRRAHRPAWWKRLYRVSTRDQVPTTNLQPLKSFGNFKALTPFKQPKWYKQ